MATKMKILIIEPDEYYHTQFREIVGPFADMVFTRGAEEGLNAAAAGDFDFLITELLLADGHAYDLLPKLQRIPIIVYTRISHLEDVEACMDHGVTGYFLKGQDSINDIKRLLLTPELLTTNY